MTPLTSRHFAACNLNDAPISLVEHIPSGEVVWWEQSYWTVTRSMRECSRRRFVCLVLTRLEEDETVELTRTDGWDGCFLGRT